MTEQEIHQVLLARALETRAPGRALGIDAAQAEAATAEARHAVGEHGDAEAFIVARARALLRRLAERWPALAAGSAAAVSAGAPSSAAGAGRSPVWPRWALPLVLAMALVLGLAGDQLASGRRIDLLGLPWLALLAWNLALYGMLLVTAVRRWGPRRVPDDPMDPAPHPWMAVARGISRWRIRAVEMLAEPAPGHAMDEAGARRAWGALRGLAAGETWLVTRHLQGWRASATLHLGAATWALAAIAAMYLRGLVLDYRAGWESTFMGPEMVHDVLRHVLALGSWPAGLALPDAEAVAALDWSDGGSGAPAGPWIHRIALTLALVVVLPRLALAAFSAWQARRLAARLPWMPDDDHSRRLRALAPAADRPVSLLPYSHQAPPASVAGADAALARHLGPGARAEWAPVLPLGAEDRLPAGLPTTLQRDVVLLFALTATPEHETHGRMVKRLAARLPAGHRLGVLIDSAGFVARLGGQRDAASRLAARSDAWQRMLAEVGAPAPWIEDLSSAADPAAAAGAAAVGAAAAGRPSASPPQHA